MEINSQTLYEALASVYRMASTDKTRPNLNGVLMEVNDGHLTTVATNGHTLAKWESPDNIEGLEGVNLSVVISLKHVKDVIRAVKKEKKMNLSILITKIDDMVIEFKGVNFCMQASCLDTQFPSYDRVIPNYCDDELKNGIISLNGYYLMLAHQCFSEILGKSQQLTIRSKEKLSSVLVTNDTTPLTVVIMPMVG